MARGTALAVVLAVAATFCGGQQDADSSAAGTGGQDDGNSEGLTERGGAAGEAGAGGRLWPPACDWAEGCLGAQMTWVIGAAGAAGAARQLPCEIEIPDLWFINSARDLTVSMDCEVLPHLSDESTDGWTYDDDRSVVVIGATDCDSLLAGEVERIDVAEGCGSGPIVD